MSVLARQRPAAVLFVFVWELAWSLVLATPLHLWASRSFGAHPDGDAVLFRPGARALLALLGENGVAGPVAIRTSLALVAFAALFAQIPLAMLLASLAAPGPAPRLVASLRAGASMLVPLFALLVIGSALAVVVLAGGGLAATAIVHGFVKSLGDVRADQFGIAIFIVFVLVALFVGVLVDLARVAIALRPDEPASSWSIFVGAIKKAFRARRLAAFGAWGWRALLSTALLAFGAIASSTFGGRGGAALVVLFAIHQIAVLGRVALRASWLARAMRLL